MSRIAILLLLAAPLCSQRRVDPFVTHERLLAVVPMVGAGTPADPRRPAFAPLGAQIDARNRAGILAFTYQLSDDGKWALAEFVARDRAAFRPILSDPRSKSFQRGKASRAVIETEFRRFRKDFDLTKFRGVALP
jgi:hypothetical protein